MKKKFNSFGILLLATLFFAQISFGQSNINLALGNPSNAKTDTTQSDNYLMVKPQYSLSYNNIKHIPNWVSWHVDSTNLGAVKRPKPEPFRADNSLPVSWYHVCPADYKNSGFDKGHQCPSGDRTDTKTNNSATYFMSNMIPQAPKNNQITWKNLEDYGRMLVGQGNEIYVICGVYGQVGGGSKGAASTIGHGVFVPAKTWKIIVVMPAGTKVKATTRVIAVLMPNTQDCSKQPWSSYRVSVDSLEQLTGYDFLSNVPEDIQKVIEAQVDNGPIK